MPVRSIILTSTNKVMYWDTAVASAAPAGPRPMPNMKTMSKQKFMTVAKRDAMNGALHPPESLRSLTPSMRFQTSELTPTATICRRCVQAPFPECRNHLVFFHPRKDANAVNEHSRAGQAKALHLKYGTACTSTLGAAPVRASIAGAALRKTTLAVKPIAVAVHSPADVICDACS